VSHDGLLSRRQKKSPEVCSGEGNITQVELLSVLLSALLARLLLPAATLLTTLPALLAALVLPTLAALSTLLATLARILICHDSIPHCGKIPHVR
jgi:hypothetical protein